MKKFYISVITFLLFTAVNLQFAFASDIPNYDKAIKFNPNNCRAYCSRGESYVFNQQYESAIKDFSKAIEINKNYFYAYNYRGEAYRLLGKYELAIKDFNKAIELYPYSKEYYNNRGKAYCNLGQYKNAINDYDKAIEFEPNYADAYNNRGIVYLLSNKYEQAIKDFKKATELNPNDNNAFHNRALAETALYYKNLYDNKNTKTTPRYEDNYINNPEYVYVTTGNQGTYYLYLKSIEIQEKNHPHYQIAGTFVHVYSTPSGLEERRVHNVMRYDLTKKEIYTRNEYGNWEKSNLTNQDYEDRNTSIYLIHRRFADALLRFACGINFYGY